MSLFDRPYDSLITDSSIWLFGREMRDIRLEKKTVREDLYNGPNDLNSQQLPRNSENKFLQKQLLADDAKLARIYSFSYQNELFDLAKPAVFLVHGEGLDPEGPNFRIPVDQHQLKRSTTNAARSGVSGQTGSFARGMLVWAYDRADFTIRLDIESGTLDRVLLGFEFGRDGSHDITVLAGGETGPPPPQPPPSSFRPPRRRRQDQSR